MDAQSTQKLNHLERLLPEGLLVDAAWLEARGYYGSLRKRYVDSGWLEQPAHRVYRRPRGELRWEQVAISLQSLLQCPLVIGGRTALERLGYAHFLPRHETEVHLYGQKPPPTWLHKLPVNANFVFHNDARLFPDDPPTRGLSSLDGKAETGGADIARQPWGQWDWPLMLSTPERAVLELLDELPDRESFDQTDKLFEGFATLSPRRLQKLLEDCRSVKVKRLFFFFADRHKPSWLSHINRKHVDLGQGKRMLARGGKLDRTYNITVPETLDAV